MKIKMHARRSVPASAVHDGPVVLYRDETDSQRAELTPDTIVAVDPKWAQHLCMEALVAEPLTTDVAVRIGANAVTLPATAVLRGKAEAQGRPNAAHRLPPGFVEFVKATGRRTEEIPGALLIEEMTLQPGSLVVVSEAWAQLLCKAELAERHVPGDPLR